ncbi:hypothetical protein CaCOL14_008978 [Colletotrichum acutatum]|uniref:DUF3752 domain-containing protein n=1 Tax=Glomerella acutata TaxID=27357 RepID=A0AAD8XQX1_GLOAC|nr:uncharacterized protein BDZ83DRAFT_645760 [Colletotrichum acutatum]KAK1731789.1 hypothetical protein BDZ83DRAFT_645760 [Colletotrichum acutatum]
MSSIGPQMPPHLTKRKRTPDDQGAGSPPPKHTRNNTDEIDLDDDDSDDDAYGPIAPSAVVAAASNNPTPSSKPSIGPTLPPSNPTNSSEIPLDDSASEDGYGLTAPRASAPAQEAPKTKPSIGPSLPPKQAIGPAMPPPDHRPSAADSDSDSDDDYGPALPSSTTSVQRAQAAAAAAAATASQGPAAPQRDDWMLAPPTQSGYQERDPTKLKNRKFASGKSSAAAAGGGGGGISSIWTETPEQKRKRLEDAVLGRGDPTAAGNEKNQQPRRTKEEVERERRISDNIASTRGKSMYEEHQANKKHGGKPGRDEEEEDDPSKRAFDKEKDMSLGGKIGTAQRRELLNKAKDFGGRFQKGSYL